MTERNGGDAVVEALAASGVEVVFGIPSVHNLPIYDALRRDGRIRAVTVRHEQGAAGAADGYARTTGRLGVCITSTGPGAANATGGLLEALLSSSPVLHLTGQIESGHLDHGRGFIHEVPDQPGMLRAVSKRHHRVESVEAIAAAVRAGGRCALAHRQGPVSVEIPIDFQYAPSPAGGGEVATSGLDTAAVPTPGDDAVAAALELIAGSARPLVWAGGGAVASGAAAEVAALVRRLGAGLLTSPNGRGLLAEDDPACIGNLPWDPGVRERCAEADLLIAIGTRFQGPNTENWKMALPSNLVQIDVDPAVPGRSYPAAAVLVSDARPAVAALLDGLGDGPALAEPGWSERIAATTIEARARLRATLGPQAGLLDALEAALPPGTIVVKDSTIPAYTWGNRLLKVSRPRTSVMPNGFAIGLGLPQALGAAAGSGGAPVVLLAGDGGFLLAATELATLAAEDLAVVAIVFADGGYGILRNIQDRQFGQPQGRIGVELGRPDFAALASSLGVAGERVDSIGSFATAVGAALGADGPRLIEVDLDAIGPMAAPYTGTSKPPVPR